MREGKKKYFKPFEQLSEKGFARKSRETQAVSPAAKLE